MNSLTERIKKLEETLKEREEIAPPLRLVKEESSVGLEIRLKTIKEEESNKKLKVALDQLRKAFFDGLTESSLPYEHLSFVEFACRFVEANVKNFCNLLDTKISSDFKKSLAISLLQEVDDTIDYSIMIDYVCHLIFPKKKKSFSTREKK